MTATLGTEEGREKRLFAMMMIAIYDETVLELRHLAALEAVVAEGTFGRAATRLGYTQSTLSQQVAALERSVGGAVFDRPGGPRPVRITAARPGRPGARPGACSAPPAQADEAIARFHAGGGPGRHRHVPDGHQRAAARRWSPLCGRSSPDCDIRLVEDETETPDLAGLDLMFFDGPGGAGPRTGAGCSRTSTCSWRRRGAVPGRAGRGGPRSTARR